MSSLYDSLKFPTRKDFRNLLGKRLGRLFVLAYAGKKERKHYWKCVCDCGEMVFRSHDNLHSGDTRSCGCLAEDVKGLNTKTHGEASGGVLTAEYKVWRGMKNRCHNPNEPSYCDYGGRGIFVCERWKRYENFIEDMGRRPTRKHTIERVNNGLGYSPENCRWATTTEQGRNKRSNTILEVDGTKRCISEWAEFLGVSESTIHSRLHMGWSINDSIQTPVKEEMRLDYNGESRTIAEWSKVTGLSTAALYARVRRGLSHEDVVSTPSRYKKRRDDSE